MSGVTWLMQTFGSSAVVCEIHSAPPSTSPALMVTICGDTFPFETLSITWTSLDCGGYRNRWTSAALIPSARTLLSASPETATLIIGFDDNAGGGPPDGGSCGEYEASTRRGTNIKALFAGLLGLASRRLA